MMVYNHGVLSSARARTKRGRGVRAKTVLLVHALHTQGTQGTGSAGHREGGKPLDWWVSLSADEEGNQCPVKVSAQSSMVTLEQWCASTAMRALRSRRPCPPTTLLIHRHIRVGSHLAQALQRGSRERRSR